MAIDPKLTFVYRFAVEEQERNHPEHTSWSGKGSGKASFRNAKGMLGPRPQFVLSEGWLTLRPSDRWTQSLPIRYFSDAKPLEPSDEEQASYREDRRNAIAAATRDGQVDWDLLKRLTEEADRRSGRKRDLASYALYVGQALGKVLRAGDELNFSRDGNGDFRYTVRRNFETVFSAGSVAGIDDGSPFAIWQEYDKHPNPNAEALRMQPPNTGIAEWIHVHKQYVTVRIKDQRFHVFDSKGLCIDPFYVYLARTNRNVPVISFEFTPRAVHGAGRLDEPGKELIVDAARQLAAPKTRLL